MFKYAKASNPVPRLGVVFKLVALALIGLLFAVVVGVVAAATTTYTDRATFESELGTTITDDYSDPNYSLLNTAAYMSSVLGETDYASTFFSPPDFNLVNIGTYCSGCNGSFLLSFTTTSVGDSSGVFGVGFDILSNQITLFHAFITFGDGSTQDVALPGVAGGTAFFGVTSDKKVRSIHLGLAGGVSTGSGSFIIDNLTIGESKSTISLVIEEAELELGPGADDDEFEVEGGFTLGASSDGIDPVTEEVKLRVGTLSLTIPVGSFEQNARGRYKFKGAVGAVRLDVKIKPKKDGTFKFQVKGTGADLTGSENPVEVGLAVGDDAGTTTVTAEIEREEEEEEDDD